MSEVKVFGLFPVPLIYCKFKNHKKYFFDDFPQISKTPDSWRCNLYTSFPNTDDNDEFIESDIISSMKEDIKNSIDECFEKLSITNDWYFENFWYNAYNLGNYQESHHHMASSGTKSPFWCGIYYNKGSSPTIFERNDVSREVHDFPNCLDCEIKESFYDEWYLNVEDGDIILFPPYLKHRVPPRDDNSTRLTFSFNLQLK